MDTIERLAQEVHNDMQAEDAPVEHMSEYVDNVVPSITTVLFQMVVEDNSLAFLDYDGEADTPFAALAGALHQAITTEIHKLRGEEQFADEDEDEDDGRTVIRITGVRPFGLFDTIIVFEAEVLESAETLNATGRKVTIGVDHRPAREIREALAAGEDVVTTVEPWQIVGGS